MQTCSDPVLFTYMICCVAHEIAGTPHTIAALNVYIVKIINSTEVGWGVVVFVFLVFI